MWKILACVIFAAAGAAALPAAAHAQASPAHTRQAEDLAQQAFEAYGKGEHQSAIALYRKAYELSPAGVILFNLANIYDKKLGDKKQALDHYQRYLRSGDTEPELVKRASERLDVIRAELEAGRPDPAGAVTAPRAAAPPPITPATTPAEATSPRPPPVTERGTRLRTAGVAAVVTGLGGLALGGAYGLIARSKNDEAAAMCPGDVCPDGRGVALTDEALRAARVSTVSFIVGGALVAGGVGLLLFAPPKRVRRADWTGLRVTPRLGGLTISGAWR